ncbi:MAG: hypothetical protein CVV24_10965 [Ignavibacteriae bacterium HGW-Ignavibacteriae-3]|nr:MAG: hypothetical protein CVV24_10965 [Ignavibacteriae bacterium HGW-Ignavibacteriae-3]
MIVFGKKLLFKIIFILIVMATLTFLVVNENGLLKYLKLRGEVKNLNEELLKAEEKLRSLDSEIDSLRVSKAKIEKVAREKFSMMKKNERVFKIEAK